MEGNLAIERAGRADGWNEVLEFSTSKKGVSFQDPLTDLLALHRLALSGEKRLRNR